MTTETDSTDTEAEAEQTDENEHDDVADTADTNTADATKTNIPHQQRNIMEVTTVSITRQRGIGRHLHTLRPVSGACSHEGRPGDRQAVKGLADGELHRCHSVHRLAGRRT